MDHPINFVRTPGSFTGKAPTRYDKPGERRRCRCGTVISPYTKGAWCTTCDRNPDRQAHYARAPKEHVMEPSKLKASKAAERLGVTGKELKQLERDGRIEPHERGRGLFGSTYLEDDVDRLKAELEAERTVADAARDLPEPTREPEPEFQIDQVTPEPDDEPEADEPLECCGQKNEGDDCFGPGCARGDEPDAEVKDEGPTDAAESFEAYARRRGMEFAEHYGKHLMHVDLAREAAADFRTNIELAQDYARNALRVQEELEKAGVKVEGIFGAPPYAATFDLDEFDETTDPEIRALYLIRNALEGLDREAQIRVVRWATAKFGIDKPLPKPQVLDLSSDAAADTAPTSPV